MDIILPRIVPPAGAGAPGLSGLAGEPPKAFARITAGDPTTDLRMSAPHGAALAAPAAGAETLVPAGEAVASGSAAKGVMESFGAVLAQAMQDVNQLYQAADLDASRLAAGEPVDLHQVMVGMEKANLSFSLALQVRNKLLEAYQEIMRMNV